MLYKIPLVFSPQPEGGFTVTSPLVPELVTEGDTFDEAMANVRDALAAVIEAYQDLGRDFAGERGPEVICRRRPRRRRLGLVFWSAITANEGSLPSVQRAH